MAELPTGAWLAALAGLPEVGPSRLRALLDRHGTPAAAWTALATGGAVADGALRTRLGGRGRELLARWSAATADVDPAAVWAAHRSAGVAVVTPADPTWPAALAEDPHAPAVLFRLGDHAALAGPAVAVVGTRACTAYGRAVAAELGRDLAAAGVAVVSGLALGIDGAAHRGALAALADADGATPVGRPVGVVGSGLDVAYPRGHRRLWREVAAAGALVSEHPLGVSPAPWRFPARNRIIAALAHVTVVVESHVAGGALGTATEAADRGRVVLAVPGPVGSGASAGTNALLADGAGVCRGAEDVLDALGLLGAVTRPVPESGSRPGRGEPPPTPPGVPGQVLDALLWGPATLEDLHARVAAPGGLADLATAVDALVAAGAVAERAGWFERTAPPT